MTTCSCVIAGGFDRAGEASGRLKETLKRLGVAPEILRRAVIAAYEAETNVVIHASHGTLEAVVGPEAIDVTVADEGPGIADIEQAMKEGFSTAPPEARALGFGAGMGLPNIRKNTDALHIDSVVGQGTRLRFSIHLAPQDGAVREPNSLRIATERCTGCLRCVRACPTHALRVRDHRPALLADRCIDCAECLRACRFGAMGMDGADRTPLPETDLVLPAALLADLGAVGREEVASAVGAAEVRLLDAWVTALRRAVRDEMRREGVRRPLIAPVCPAVVSFIRLRFPSLLGHLAPWRTPIEAMRAELAGRRVAVAPLCPGQATLLRGGGDAVKVLSTHALRARLRQCLVVRPAPARPAVPVEGDIVTVAGMAQVRRVLEEMENGLLGDVPALELYACPGGCAGSPFMPVQADVAAWRQGPSASDEGARALRCDAPRTARAGLRLDREMGEAIRKLAEIDRLTHGLPGYDCALCGAPVCQALAEDIVLRRARIEDCPVMKQRMDRAGATPGGKEKK